MHRAAEIITQAQVHAWELSMKTMWIAEMKNPD